MYEMLHKTANVAQGHIRGFVPIGSRHEAKDIGLGIAPKGMNDFNKAQHDRYVKALPNLIYTNGLDFRFYKKGELAREISIGDLLMATGDHAGARAAYEATLQKEPNRFRAVAGAASAALAAGDRAGARVYYRALLALAGRGNRTRRPDLARAREVLGGRP